MAKLVVCKWYTKKVKNLLKGILYKLRSIIYTKRNIFVRTKRKLRDWSYFSMGRNSTILLQKLSYFPLSKQLTLMQVEQNSRPFVFSSFSRSSN
uniref:Putative ovule protein n=1 Tax=Solanum chacoense TaxID=4108 RepID=A0A0V0HV00_SOLCH